jgi:hypothetical protein
MELSLGVSYSRPADFRTTLETEARVPALKLYELDNVEGQSNTPFACSFAPRPAEPDNAKHSLKAVRMQNSL